MSRTGMLWRYSVATGDELIRAWEYARSKHGADALTGKVFGRSPALKGVEEDRSIPNGYWLIELHQRATEPNS